MADETKVGHGFVECDRPAERCETPDGCHAVGLGAPSCCALPRSAHPGEETRVEPLKIPCDPGHHDFSLDEDVCSACHERFDGLAPAGIAEEPDEQPDLTYGAVWSGAWGAYLVNGQDCYGKVKVSAEALQKLLLWSFPRVRSEGGGEKAGCAVGSSGHWLGHYGPSGEIQCRYCGRTPTGILRGQPAPSGEKGWQQGYRAGHAEVSK